MFGKNEDPTITELKKTQNELNKKLTLLNEEARRLRGEISQVETAKNDVNSNQTKIDKVLKEITGLQRGIKAELTKLSNQITSITPSTTTNSVITDGPPPPPPPPGVPPPPPPPGIKTQQPLPKRTVSPKVEQSLQSKPETPKTFDPNDLNAGRSNLRTRGEKPVENKTQEQIQKEKEEEIKRYQNGNEKKEADIERLLTLVSSLSSKLETEKASQGEYQQALQNQTELLTDLNNKKGALEGKLKTVSVQVGDELAKIKEKMEEEKLVQQEQNTTSIGDAPIPPPPNIPPPPPPPNNIPPPPPPPGNITGSKQSKPQGKRDESPTSPTEEKKVSSSSSAEKPQLDTDAIQQAALAKRQRLEAKEIKDYLVGKLVDTVVEEAMVEEGTMEYTDNQQRLIDLIGEDGYENLKTSMAKSIDEDPNISKEDKQIHIRRAKMEDLPAEIATIPHYKDNARLKEAVGQFIDNDLNKDDLLKFSKESRQQETIEKQKQAEVEAFERAREKEARDKKIAEEQKLKALQESQEVKKQLSAMGIKEGVVDTTGVKKAQADKEQVIDSVVSKKPVIQEVDSFLSNIDNELNERVIALQKAEELRVEALKNAALEIETPIVETPIVETPIVETPIVETPIVETPVVETPVVETPVVETPVDENQVDENQVDENQVDENQVDENQAVANPVVERTTKEQARLKLLDESGFNAKLNAIQYVAINLSNQNKPEAALEVFNIFKKLDACKYEFIKNGDNKELAEKCEKAIEPAVTKNLSEQKSAFGWIKKTIANIVHAITGKPHKEMDINVAKELKEDMKTTLKEIRNKASKEEPQPDNTVSSRHQL